jgi:secondary thiamine-phosphate synthase enzyme
MAKKIFPPPRHKEYNLQKILCAFVTLWQIILVPVYPGWVRKQRLPRSLKMILTIKSRDRTELIDITADIQDAIRSAKIREGFCYVFVPHTTAAVTINENADPDVRIDIKDILNKMIPWKGGYRHIEGNSAAHMKASLVGASELVAIEDGGLVLGTWQGIYFCEFDGPRSRKVVLKLMHAPSEI